MDIYKIILQYQGTGYQGWQIQPQEEKTVQGQLNLALKKICSDNNFKTLGASRTDSGVHAFGQVVRIDMINGLEPLALQNALNAHLPEDIQVMGVEKTHENFHPIADAKWKEYHYLFSTTKNPPVFSREFITHYPYQLNLELMQTACNILIGQHDFINFQCTGTEVSSTRRTIFSCGIEKRDFSDSFFGPHYYFYIRGDGFLKQMVRQIMGALWEIGRGKVSLTDLSSSLIGEHIERLGATAPPQGLYLKVVHY